MGGLLVAATLLGGLALTSTAASAIVVDNEQPPPTEVCYEQVRELQYQRSVPTYGDVIDKETRTRNWVKGEAGFWQNFEPNKDQGTFQGPPSWPSDLRGTWSKAKENGGPQQDTSGVFQNGEGNGSWFYRDLGTEGSWGDWGPWTDWGAKPLNDDGRDRGPLPHGEGKGWQREYRYVVVGQFQNGSTTETSEWLRESAGPPQGEGWEVTDKRFVDGDRIPCDEQPEGFTTEREVAEPCTRTGQTTTTVTVYAQDWTHELNSSFEWVAVKDDDEYVVKTYERDLTDEEKADCPIPETTPPPIQPPTQPLPMVTTTEWVDGTYVCDDTTVTQTRVEVTTPYILVDGVWVLDTASAVSEPQTQERDLTTEEFEECVNVLPPLAPEVAPAAPSQSVPPAAPTQLPSTGSSTWVMALIALTALAGGSGLLRLSRRTTD
jgi:LPXTG-motif cell wall-anchored protein